ncbi:MAG TPA: ABC transporter substrate-binding protein, partial [Verrucomicrobiales bacterium]|nr:ABC transporter substrate-binding protein [Verrucomicrobiales bacterium]
MKIQLSLASILLAVSVGGCNITGVNQATTQTSNDRELLVWWSEGYYPEETDAIESITRKWEQNSGNKVKLVFFNDGEISQRATE